MSDSGESKPYEPQLESLHEIPNEVVPPPSIVAPVESQVIPVPIEVAKVSSAPDVCVVTVVNVSGPNESPSKLSLLRGGWNKVAPAPDDVLITVEDAPGPSNSSNNNNPETGVSVDSGSGCRSESGASAETPGSEPVMACRGSRSYDSYEEVCRICHDTPSKMDIITPCLCKGEAP